MFPINGLTLIKINGDPPVRWAEFEVDNSDDPETVADVRAALEDRGHVLAGGGGFAEYENQTRVRREQSKVLCNDQVITKRLNGLPRTPTLNAFSRNTPPSRLHCRWSPTLRRRYRTPPI